MKYYILKRETSLGIKYIQMGKMTRKNAVKREHTLYGTNTVLTYQTKEEYQKAIIELNATK